MSRRIPASFFKAGLIGLAIATIYLAVLQPFSVLEIPRLKTQDLFFRLRHMFPYRHFSLNDIVLITIDDESIERTRERWPFKRRIYAELLEKIDRENPKLIGFDFIFSGKGDPADDLLLAAVIKKSGNVILASVVDTTGRYMLPLQELHLAAQASGAVNKLLDRDLYVRRANLLYRDAQGNFVGWPWEVELVKFLLGLSPNGYRITKRGIQFADELFVPFYDRSNVLINYRFNLKDIDHAPFWRVMETGDWTNRFRDKVVLIGATSKVLHDDYHTPLGLMPGVVVNMNMLLNLLAKDFLKKMPLVLDAIFVFLFVFLASYLGLREDVSKGLMALGIMTVAFAAIFFTFFLNNYVGDYFTPFFLGWAAFLTTALYHYFGTFLENIQLKGKVVTDPLTGLFNRRMLESRIDLALEELAHAKGARRGDPFYELSILMIDIDDFKKINDTYGHQFGDDVLKNVSYCIKENTRKDDLAARFGGEEFCVVLPHTSKEDAEQIAEKIRASIAARKFNYVNQVASFTVSVGVASAKTDNLLASRSLIRAADKALYEAKRSGKNKVFLYETKLE